MSPREAIASKKVKETLEDAGTVHGIASLSNIKMILESIRKMVYEENVVAYSNLLKLDTGNLNANVAEKRCFYPSY